jgi:hypothetical protein
MTGFPSLPPRGGDGRQVAAVVNRMNRGKLNCTGVLTLAPGETATMVSDGRVGPDSHIALTPLTAAALASGSLYVSGRGDGGFSLAHADTAEADRSFSYAVLG